ncbi:hypothetical protein FOZ60_000750 [Perkinsus olseni]|uniref:RNase H type-1 domain-containing protein n=1 Tax=Perkinsus olseni TaxID=32597 RepID=A0A7J6P2E0_PEROL|nr:hypothetical protein FOZ60_000750 [Perkinsus olseni]
MVLFQLPHHFEALRCMAIERLWDGEQSREPMHHLMGDIMGYCRKAELTLDCPNEKILVDEQYPVADFSFIDDGIPYQLCRSGQSIRLYSVSTTANCAPSSTGVSTLCTDATEYEAFKCYYDEDTRKLYVLYNNGGVLLQHDMASGKTEEPIRIPHLAACDGETAGIVVASGCLYVGKKYFDSRRGVTEKIEFLCSLVGSTEVRPVHTVHRQRGSLSFGCFTRVPGHPQAVDALYESGIGILGEYGILTEADELVKAQEIKGELLGRMPGLGSLLVFSEDGRYVLRHHRGCKKSDCELLGVLEAVRWIVSTAGDEDWEIFTDSQAVLKILSSRASTARWDKARQIYLSLSEIPGRVSFRWVPGHSSISANERADELAAKGASMREVSAETEISVRTLRRYQGEAGRLSLRKWWSDKRASLGTSVNDFFYCASHARLWIRGEVTAASSAVVFGRAPTPAHLYRCGVVNSPECDCGAPVGNTRHYLLSCPLLEQARNRVKGGVPYHLCKLIVDLKRRKSFNQLCSALMQYLDARRGLL